MVLTETGTSVALQVLSKLGITAHELNADSASHDDIYVKAKTKAVGEHTAIFGNKLQKALIELNPKSSEKIKAAANTLTDVSGLKTVLADCAKDTENDWIASNRFIKKEELDNTIVEMQKAHETKYGKLEGEHKVVFEQLTSYKAKEEQRIVSSNIAKYFGDAKLNPTQQEMLETAIKAKSTIRLEGNNAHFFSVVDGAETTLDMSKHVPEFIATNFPNTMPSQRGITTPPSVGQGTTTQNTYQSLYGE
jgi:hypothetical protein